MTTSMVREADISDDSRYRYTLLRRWTVGGPAATFVMLNPSTADAEQDDPTIRRCIGYARAWGMSAVRVVNLYALRATNPRELWQAADPVGPSNDAAIASCALVAAHFGHPIVAAWGAHARPDRVAAVLALPGMERLHSLGVTKAGQPRHPLYLPAAATLRPWPPQAGAA